MNTTAGPWILAPGQNSNHRDFLSLVQVITANENPTESRIVAMCPNVGDAALIAVSLDMLDTLIAIQETLMRAQTIDRDAMLVLISDVFEKLANEAGEEI